MTRPTGGAPGASSSHHPRASTLVPQGNTLPVSAPHQEIVAAHVPGVVPAQDLAMPPAGGGPVAPAQHRRAAWAGRAMSEGRAWPATFNTPISSHMTQSATPARLLVATGDADASPRATAQRAQTLENNHIARIANNDAPQRAAARLDKVATKLGGPVKPHVLTTAVESLVAPALAAANAIQLQAQLLFRDAQTAANVCTELQGLELLPAQPEPGHATAHDAARQLLLYTLSAHESGPHAAQALRGLVQAAAPQAGQHSLVRGTPAAATSADAPITAPLLGPVVAQGPEREGHVAALKLACSLASTGPGFDVLHHLTPELRSATDTAHQALLRKEAVRQAFHAAAPLQAALQRAGQPVGSLAELEQTCQRLLPQSQGGQAPVRPTRRDDTRALRRETLAAKAFLAAMALAANPAAELSPPLKDAYFSFRNGFRHEGKGTPLSKAQHRLFKLTTYMQRAADNAQGGVARSMWQGVKQSLGKSKSPLDAMVYGTGGARLRQAPADFGKVTTGIGALRTALQARVAGHAEGPALQGLRIRLAALDEYERILVSKGWRDEVRLGRSGVDRVVAQASASSGRPEPSRQSMLQSVTSTANSARALLSAGLRRSTSEQSPGVALTSAGTSASTSAAPHADTAPDTPGDSIATLAAHEQAQQLARAPMNPALLSEWAQGTDNATQQAVAAMGSLLNQGDPLPQPINSADDVYQQLRSVARDAHATFDVKHQKGGRTGLNYRASVLTKAAGLIRWATDHHAPVPGANFAARMAHARMAMVDVGSSSHGGTCFVGTDRRLDGGLGGEVGLYGRRGVAVGGGAWGLGGAGEGSMARGVMLRTRIFTKMTGEPPFQRRPDDADPVAVPLWRAKLLSAMDVIAVDGPGAAPWGSPESMWSALAGQFCQDLDVSINAVNLGSSSWTVTRPTQGAVGFGRAEGSPAVSVPVGSRTSVSTWLSSRRSETGSFEVDTIVSQHNLSKVLGLGAAGRLPLDWAHDIDHNGHTLAEVAAGAPLLGATMPVDEHHVNVRLRLAQQDGRVEPTMTYLDTEFGSVDDYAAYLQSREDLAAAQATGPASAAQRRDDPAWSTSLPAGAVDPPDPAQARAALLQHLQEQTGEADRSGQFFCERRQLREDVASRIDDLRALREAVMQSSLSAPQKKSEVQALDAAVAMLIKDNKSWGNRFLFTMEQNGAMRALGPAVTIQAQTVQQMQHLHMTHAIKAAGITP